MANQASRRSMETLRDAAPEVADAFVALRSAVDASGPLDAKTRALIICGAFVATNNEVGFRSHCQRAVAAGATPEELRQEILLALGFTQGVANVARGLTWLDETMGLPEG